MREVLAGAVIARALRGDNQDERAYCLIEECSQPLDCCLIRNVPVASRCRCRSDRSKTILLFDPCREAFFRPDQRNSGAIACSSGQGWPRSRGPEGLVLDGRKRDGSLLGVGT
jgi:hypothetical protein